MSVDDSPAGSAVGTVAESPGPQFVDPEHREIEAARASGADCIELHTGPYTDSVGAADLLWVVDLQRV